MFDHTKEAEGLDRSTFDILRVDAFHNTRFWTVMSFVWVWILLLLKLAILGGDTYTCVSILVFNRWSLSDYEVYEYKVAKWIFTGCILFRFLLLAYQIAWGIHIYRTRNIALAYLNNYARMMYALRSYDYQCLFHEIEHPWFFPWACFYVYTEMDNALEVLVADLPRQVINFMTLRYYATGGELNNDILANIKLIATTNLMLSVILSFQLCTMVLFLFFFCRFLLGLLLYIPIKVKSSHKGHRLLKAYCYKAVNDRVRFLVRRNHKPKLQLYNEGILPLGEIQANPLLASSSTMDLLDSGYTRDYDYHQTKDLESYAYPSYPHAESGSTISLADLDRPNPFADLGRDRFVSNAPGDPFADSPVAAHFDPLQIRPPVRSQTSDSLMARRADNNSMFSSDVPQYSRLKSTTPHKNDSSAELLLRRRPEPFDSESGSDTSSLKGEKPPTVAELTHLDDDAPYPVRGVSQYFEGLGREPTL